MDGVDRSLRLSEPTPSAGGLLLREASATPRSRPTPCSPAAATEPRPSPVAAPGSRRRRLPPGRRRWLSGSSPVAPGLRRLRPASRRWRLPGLTGGRSRVSRGGRPVASTLRPASGPPPVSRRATSAPTRHPRSGGPVAFDSHATADGHRRPLPGHRGGSTPVVVSIARAGAGRAPDHPARPGQASVPVDVAAFGAPVESTTDTVDAYAAQWAAEAEAAERRRYQGHYQSLRIGFESNRRPGRGRPDCARGPWSTIAGPSSTPPTPANCTRPATGSGPTAGSGPRTRRVARVRPMA